MIFSTNGHILTLETDLGKGDGQDNRAIPSNNGRNALHVSFLPLFGPIHHCASPFDHGIVLSLLSGLLHSLSHN